MFLNFVQMEPYGWCTLFYNWLLPHSSALLRACICSAVFLSLAHRRLTMGIVSVFLCGYGHVQGFLLTTCPGAERLGHKIRTSSATSDNVKLFSRMVVLAYAPTSSVEVFQRRCISSITWYSFFYLGTSMLMKVNLETCDRPYQMAPRKGLTHTYFL